MRLFKKRAKVSTAELEQPSKRNSEIYPPLLYAAWAMIVIFVIVFGIISLTTLASKYEGEIFYISDSKMPTIKDAQFVENADGSYQVKLYGLISMGNCRVVTMDRPTVNLIPSAIVVSSDVDDLPVIKDLLPEHPNAKNAGLQIGDIVYAINDQLLSHEDWRIAEKYDETKPNKFTIIRNGEFLDIWCSTDDEGFFGINYGTAEYILGSIGFAVHDAEQDKYHVISVGHNVAGTLHDSIASEIRYTLSDDSTALNPVLVADSILISEVQDAYGLVFTPSEYFYDMYGTDAQFIGNDNLSIAWDWEIDTSKPATVLIPYYGLYDSHGVAMSTPVEVKVDEFMGTLVDPDGNVKKSDSDLFALHAYDDTYATTVDIINGEGCKTAYDYSIDATDKFAFLSGMSGCPVIQDGKLIGMVTSADVTDPTTAYMVTAQQLYLNYLSNMQDTSF